MRRYTMLLVLTGLMFGGLIGCEMPDIPLELPSNSGNDAENSGNNSADSANNATTPEWLKNQPPDDWVGDSTSPVFYLKYIANDGKGCLLMPRSVKGTEVSKIMIAGQETRRPYYPVLKDGKIRNGGRLHARLHTLGSNFKNCLVTVYYHNGTTKDYPVGEQNHPDGYKKKY